MRALYVGLISGTSADGIDAVAADLSDAKPHVLAATTTPYPDDLHKRLQRLLNTPSTSLAELGRLDVALGECFAACALAVIDATGLKPADFRAIGHHGQTVFHAPDSTNPFTLQIGDPNVVAARTGLVTVADFRRMDIAFGGQGAPLVPAFHDRLWGRSGSAVAVLNLGGIANITVLPESGPITGFDTGPANTLLDAWIRNCRRAPFDRNGEWSARGAVDNELLRMMREDPYFSRPPPKSTGRELFNMRWLRNKLTHFGKPISEVDVQATLAELTAATVAEAIAGLNTKFDRIIVCGGGAYNADLLRRITAATGNVIETSALHGIEPDWVEAAAFAWLAQARLENVAGNVPSVTGAREHALLGGVYCPTIQSLPPSYGQSASTTRATDPI